MKIGIITDIHENAGLLAESLRIASVLKCDEVACLGDIVGYDRRFYDYDSQRSARECIRLIRTNCRWITIGNHDLFAARIFPSWSNGFTYPDDWFNLDPLQRKSISSGRVWCYDGDSPNDLTEDDIEFLRNIPEFIITHDPGIPCLFSHYFAPDYTGSTTIYIKRKAQLCQHWDVLSKNNIIYSFSGHSHNHFTGFAYRSAGLFSKAIQSFPGDIFNLGNEMTAIVLPPLSGEKKRRGFTVIDTAIHQMRIIDSF
jgi:predicted phosphodiesterase